MATKTTKAPAPAAVEVTAPKNAAEAKKLAERMAQNDKFIYSGNLKEGTKKLPPQAQGIVNIVQAAGKKGVTRAELTKQMEGVVATKQPYARIVTYYQKQLVEQGYVTIEKATTLAEAA